jgi:restriction system protein
MAKKDENILNLLSQSPWWVSICIAVVVYMVLKPIAPAFSGIAIIFLAPETISAFNSIRKRHLLDAQSGINSIRSLSWKQFEELIAEAYRREGFHVVENDGTGPDGGIDLILKKNGKKLLVQCKQWKSYKVGVKVVREMYGIMMARHAAGVIVITSDIFTQEAKNFAAGKPIDLIDGQHVHDLVRNARKENTPQAPYSPPQNSSRNRNRLITFARLVEARL